MTKKNEKDLKTPETLTKYEAFVKARKAARAWLVHAINGLGHPEQCFCDKCLEAKEILTTPQGDATGAPHKVDQESE